MKVSTTQFKVINMKANEILGEAKKETSFYADTIDKLIKHLEEVKKEHGNIGVGMFNHNKNVQVGIDGLIETTNDYSRVSEVLILGLDLDL